jgi:hypothetical protein
MAAASASAGMTRRGLSVAGLLVALETVGTHAEGQRHDGAGDRRCLDVPVALGQNAGQLAADERVALSVVAKAEQGACKLSVPVGHEQHVDPSPAWKPALFAQESAVLSKWPRSMSERETAQTGSESPDISANGEVRSIWLIGRHGISCLFSGRIEWRGESVVNS